MTNPDEMNFDTALALLESNDPFPVDFDAAWQWLGYASKGKAKDKLLRNYNRGEDFLTKGLKTPLGGRPSEYIKISLDCFKSFCMMAGTEKGKEVRRYFLQCERQLKQVVQAPKSDSFLIELIEHRICARLAPRFESIEERLQCLESMNYSRQKPNTLKETVRLLPTKMTSDSQLIMEYLNQHKDEKFHAEQLAQLLNLSYNSLRRILPVMCRTGLIEKQKNPAYKNNRSGRGIPRNFYTINCDRDSHLCT